MRLRALMIPTIHKTDKGMAQNLDPFLKNGPLYFQLKNQSKLPRNQDLFVPSISSGLSVSRHHPQTNPRPAAPNSNPQNRFWGSISSPSPRSSNGSQTKSPTAPKKPTPCRHLQSGESASGADPGANAIDETATGEPVGRPRPSSGSIQEPIPTMPR